MEGVANAFGHFAVDDDRNRVVGRCQVRNRNQCGNPQLSRILPFDKLLDIDQEEGNAAGLIDHGSQTARNKGEEENIRHPQEALIHSLGKGQDGQVAIDDADTTGQEDAAKEDEENISAGYGRDEDDDVGQYLNQRKGMFPCADCRFRTAKENQQDDRHDGRDQGQPEVQAELILHGTALRARRSNGRIGNNGQVVAQHDTAHDAAHHEGHGNAGLFGDGNGNGADRCGTAYRGARSRSDEAGNDEYAGCQIFRRNIRKAQIDRRVDAAHGLTRSGKAAGQEVNDAHDDNIGITTAAYKGFKLFFKGSPNEDKGRYGADGCRQGSRELVKGHFHTAHI